ncbi:MAG: hypothetical protein M3406_06340 [Chloroflexota bacterium]|nr:hypothetical protein [Chloroflexota bacterium]
MRAAIAVAELRRFAHAGRGAVVVLRSAKSKDAVYVGRIEFLAELPQIATDDRRELQRLASQPPKLITMAPESFTRLR